jgi:hypothetical protein
VNFAAVATALILFICAADAQDVAPTSVRIIGNKAYILDTKATEADWAICDKHPNVTSINVNVGGGSGPLPVWNITSREFAHIAKCVNLEELYMPPRMSSRDPHALADDVLQALTGLKKLRILMLTDWQVSDAGIAHLAGLTSLESLRLAGNNSISDRGLASLRRLTNLKSLSLSETQLTDAGMRSLTAFAELAMLEISGLPVTDATIPVLLGLKKLKSIEITGTRITAAGEAQLKAAGIVVTRR